MTTSSAQPHAGVVNGEYINNTTTTTITACATKYLAQQHCNGAVTREIGKNKQQQPKSRLILQAPA